MEKKVSSWQWWFLFAFSAILLVTFLIFGIHILIISFSLNNPLVSLPTFFSASLMILVCLSLLAGLIVKLLARKRKTVENIPDHGE